MYEKILVPLDGSELAEVALPYAEEAAGKLGKEITLLTVLISDGFPDEGWYHHLHRFYTEKMVDIVKQDLQKKLGEAAAKKIKVKSEIMVGDPAEEIVNYAEKNDIGLIVMSTHGLHGFKRWAMGSVTERVARATTRPIALIRAKGNRPDFRDSGALRKIIVPLDGSQEGESAISYAGELAARFKAEVVLFKVMPAAYKNVPPAGEQFESEKEEATVQIVMGYNYKPSSGHGTTIYPEQQMESDKEKAKNYLDKAGERLIRQGVTLRSEVRFGNTAEEIIKFAGEAGVDMVVLSTHGHSAVDRWVFSNVVEKVFYQGNTPLLLVRAPRASKE